MISVCGQIGIPREIQPVQSGDDNPSHESTLGIKPGPHWCEARTLTTEPVGRLRYQVYMKIKPSKSLTDLVLYTATVIHAAEEKESRGILSYSPEIRPRPGVRSPA